MKEREYFYDLHCHTKASPDSPETIEEIVKTAKRRGLAGVAVTDHNAIYEGPTCVDGIDIIPGTEVNTKERRHLLGFFVKELVEENKSFKESVKKIKLQGGYSVWAHPARGGDFSFADNKEDFSALDGLETGNAMDSEEERDFTKEVARKFSLSETGGSDAHVFGQVGTGVLVVPERLTKENFKENLKKGKVIVREEITEFRNSNRKWKKLIGLSQKIMGARRSETIRKIFARIILRNYMRVNNKHLKKIDFNHQKNKD